MSGIIDFIGGVLMAVLYNLAAGWIGGMKVETEQVGFNYLLLFFFFESPLD